MTSHITNLKGAFMSKISKIAGIIFLGGWCLLGTVFFIKAIIDFVT